jgi:hypothetical protein
MRVRHLVSGVTYSPQRSRGALPACARITQAPQTTASAAAPCGTLARVYFDLRAIILAWRLRPSEAAPAGIATAGATAR